MEDLFLNQDYLIFSQLFWFANYAMEFLPKLKREGRHQIQISVYFIFSKQ